MLTTPNATHNKFMQVALNLARRGIGETAPNPSVACVIVKDGVIIAQGRTAKGGLPHAETIALQKAGENAKGSTIYVTLEPCSHTGKTPPCADSIIAAQPAEVVVACLDPFKKVNGRGIKKLAKAGIKITIGIGEDEAQQINRGFLKRVTAGTPFITLKAAISADGKYLQGTGTPQWVTGEPARNYVHLLRSRSDCLITGTGTVIADKPKLNVRLPGMEHLSPLVVVIGKRKTENFRPHAAPLKNILTELADEGVNNAMVESGPTLAASFIKQKLVDELIIIQSPQELGDKGRDYFDVNTKKLLEKNFRLTSSKEVGVDKILVFSKIK